MSQPARWITAVATALLLLLLSAPSQAAKPEREVVPFEGTRFPFFPCSEFGYDFDILVDFFGSDTVTTWRDSEGNITRIKVHDYGTGTIYPDTDPTNRETGSGPINITVDFLKETYTLSGQRSHNNVPGEGRVAHQSGTITFAHRGARPPDRRLRSRRGPASRRRATPGLREHPLVRDFRLNR